MIAVGLQLEAAAHEYIARVEVGEVVDLMLTGLLLQAPIDSMGIHNLSKRAPVTFDKIKPS